MIKHHEYNGEAWVEVSPPQTESTSAQVYGDIAPYTSMIDGSTITSRSHHRTHLHDHGCIEIGNESMTTTPAPPSSTQRRAVLREQLARLSNAQAQTLWRQLLRDARQRKD